MSIYRSGHATSCFVSPNGQTGVQYHGGNGKIAPDIVSATTTRLFSPVSAIYIPELSPIPHNEQQPEMVSPIETNQPLLQYSYKHPLSLTSIPQTLPDLFQDFVPYTPITREHSVAHTISTPQIPALLYLFVLNSLKYHYQDNFDNPQGLDTIFSVLYGGRQSPSVPLSDLWLHYRLEDLWIQCLQPKRST
jgi:hypothetical protein